jgi:DNA repair exonuclease SbcCD ATPase subunit
MLRAQLEHTQLAQKQAQQELQNAVLQTEQASKGTRAARNRETKLERELNKSKEREAELGRTIETLSKQNAQLEIQVHTLNQRARQARQALSELQSSGAGELDRARSEVQQLKRRLTELMADSEHRNAGMVKRTEEIASALRADLEQHQALLQTERDARRDSEEKVVALENERQQLAKDMQEAARCV